MELTIILSLIAIKIIFQIEIVIQYNNQVGLLKIFIHNQLRILPINKTKFYKKHLLILKDNKSQRKT